MLDIRTPRLLANRRNQAATEALENELLPIKSASTDEASGDFARRRRAKKTLHACACATRASLLRSGDNGWMPTC
jgi:hypothetical protein